MIKWLNTKKDTNSSITINGTNVDIVGGNIIVDGVRIESEDYRKVGVTIIIKNKAKVTIDSKSAIRVEGDIHGDVKATSINARDITGSVDCSTINCDDVRGNVNARGSVNCSDVRGNVTAQIVNSGK